MIPNNKVYNIDVGGDYLFEKPYRKLVDVCLGGISLQDPSEGLDYQVWELTYNTTDIVLKSLTTNYNEILKSGLEGVEKISLSFDHNMNYVFCYKVADNVSLVYYNSSINDYDTMIIKDCRDPILIFDDYRVESGSQSDVILFYIENTTNKLFCRLLRDRYSKEIELLQLTLKERLINVGFTTKYRLRFKIKSAG